jgi:hypothetical protein
MDGLCAFPTLDSRNSDLPLVETEQLLDSLDSRKARLVVIHPLTRTNKAGLLGSQQQSGSI